MMTKTLINNKQVISFILLIVVGSIGQIFAKFDGATIDSICNAIESDVERKNDVKIYTLFSLSGDSIPLDNNRLSNVFISDSFARMAHVLLDDNLLNEFDLYDGWYSKDYFAVNRFNYLFNCTYTGVLYTIAEQLLKEDDINGMLGLWNNCDIQQLPSYMMLKNKVIANDDLYRHAILTAIMFNSKYLNEYIHLRTIMRNKYGSYPVVVHLLNLFDNNDAISLNDFMNILDSY